MPHISWLGKVRRSRLEHDTALPTVPYRTHRLLPPASIEQSRAPRASLAWSQISARLSRTRAVEWQSGEGLIQGLFRKLQGRRGERGARRGVGAAGARRYHKCQLASQQQQPRAYSHTVHRVFCCSVSRRARRSTCRDPSARSLLDYIRPWHVRHAAAAVTTYTHVTTYTLMCQLTPIDSNTFTTWQQQQP